MAAKSNRDEFPLAVKIALADRAGNVCSYPECAIPTSGPSDEGPMATANTGIAAHIAAASGGPGARRVVPTMTPEERRSIDNGIWMCSLHGKLVDTDEVRFTIPVLREMKALAENRAKLRQSGQAFLAERYDLLHHEIEISTTTLSETTVANALSDAAIPLLWGPAVSAAVRDLIFELAQNAFVHGHSTNVVLKISPKVVTLEDNGANFSLDDLTIHSGARGGASALRSVKALGANLIVAHKFRLGNTYTIQYLRSHADIVAETPCHAHVDPWNREQPFDRDEILRTADCPTVYIILPAFMAHSRAIDLRQFVAEELPNKRVVFVGHQLSIAVQELLLEIPNSTYFELPEN